MRKLITLVAIVLAVVTTGKAALSGNYTINALAPASATNYQSLSAAVSDMNAGTRADGGPINGPGVSGPVTLRIAAGTGPYNEQVTIPSIAGASSTNTIRITGGPTRETVTFAASTTADRQVIKLNGCSYVTLDSLTLINTGTTYGYGVHITNSADFNTVQNCIVHVDSSSTSSNFSGITISGATVTTNGDWGDNNLIDNNVTNGGYYGITCRGTSTTVFNVNNRISFNKVRSFYYYGISVAYQDYPEVTGNQVTARATGTTAGYGVYLINSDRFKIDRNYIIRFGTYGIYMSAGNYQGGAPTSRAKIVNNMIGGLNLIAASAYGIYITSTTNQVDVWHNSVHTNGTSGRSIYILNGSGNDVRNNSFYQSGSTTGYALYVTSTAYVSGIDYNNYYVPGSSNFIYIGAAYTSGTFIGGGGYNTNSRTGDPGYTSTSNLHVATGLQLWDVGTNLSISTDIDGDVRPGAPTAIPDMGADEYTPASNDAGITALNSPLPPFAGGLLPVTVTLRNFGVATLNSANIGWTVNGTPQTPYAWSGTLAPAASVAGVNIGSYTFAAGSSYTLKIWSYSPNGSSDANNTNDTLYVSVCTSYAGTYTIGGGGADFPNVNAAIAALVCGGVSGPVTLRLNPGTGPFSEQVVIPAIAGASATNTIRLTGGPTRETIQTGTTTTTDRYVIDLNGADHFILDSLTIINTNTTFAFSVQFENSADSNTIQNSIIRVDSASTSSNIVNISFSGDAAATLVDAGDGNIIQNNLISGGYYVVNVRGLSTTSFNFDNKVLNNTITGGYFYSSYAANQGRFEFSGNNSVSRTAGSTTNYGLYLSYVDHFLVSQNYFNNFGGYGIYGTSANYQGGAPTIRANIVNNMIGGTWRGTTPYGIYLTTNATYINIFHNTVSLTSGNGRCLYLLSGQQNDVRNNSFTVTNSTTGYAMYVSSTAYVNAVNYNNYYAPGSSNFIYLGAAYSTATYVGGGGYNLNSRDGDPLYTDPFNDLHTFGTQMNDVGDNSVAVAVDIDGDVRPLSPSIVVDMGADEFLPLQYNAQPLELVAPGSGNCPDSAVAVYVSLTNLGLAPMTGIIVTAEITGASPAILSDTLTDPLPSGVVDTVLVGYWNSYPGGTNNFRIYTSHPLEEYMENDSMDATVLVNIEPPAPSGTGATGCSPADLDMIANPDGFSHRWYDDPVAGTLLLQGDTLATGLISSTTTYWLEAVGFGLGSLTTTFAGGNGCMGTMFDVEALSAIRIDSLDQNIGATSPETVYIYYRTSSYVGFETNAAAWLPLDTISIPAAAGAGLATRVVLKHTLDIPAGATYGIYVTLTVTDVDYTNGTTTFSNADMNLFTGVGLCSAFGGTNAGRMWNGTLYYTKETCPSDRVPVVATIIPTPVVDLGPDTATCGLPVMLDAENPGAIYLWSTAQTTQTISALTTGSYDVTVNFMGCVASDTVSIVVNAIPNANLGPDTSLCTGSTVTLDPGTGGVTYLWSTSDTTPTIDVGPGGTYYVDVADSVSGCADSDTITIGEYFFPSGSFAIDSTLCPDISFDATTSGTGPFTYMWDFGDGGTSTLEDPSNDYFAAGNGIYPVQVIVTNLCGSDTLSYDLNIGCILSSSLPLSSGVSVWPNPSTGVFHISSSLSEALTYDVFNLQGQAVSSGAVPAGGSAELSLENFSRGVYHLVLRSGSQMHTSKLVVQ